MARSLAKQPKLYVTPAGPAPQRSQPPEQTPGHSTDADKLTSEKIAVVGLGYVGLPVAVALSHRYAGLTGFDINPARVTDLTLAKDGTGEVERAQLLGCGARFTAHPNDLIGASVFIVAVPTPVTAAGRPDFGPLRKACRLIAPCLRPGAAVVFESTVYPGATEEICLPELERYSGYTEGEDFHIAYSPERINPGDKIHGLSDVTKIVAAREPATLDRIAALYGEVVSAGVHRAPSIKVAEAAKVFENTQRDVNIALTNELSRICDRVGIATRDVLSATGTKWNALPFTPGLVGGHCIGVDPLYLSSRAQELGLFPEVILAARRSNEQVPQDLADKTLRVLAAQDRPLSEARVGVLGVTFKENVPDTRNSKVFDLLAALHGFRITAKIHDPLADPADLARAGLHCNPLSAITDLDVLILAVPHQSYLIDNGARIQSLIAPGGALLDVRAALAAAPLRPDIQYWSL